MDSVSTPESAQKSSTITQKKPSCYFIICNISKNPNIKTLLKTSVAFGCRKIFVCGQKKFCWDYTSDKHHIPHQIVPLLKNGTVQIIHFNKLQDCISHLHSQDIQVVGIEIDETAVDVDHPDCFNDRDVAFMAGNEGQGMNINQMKSCDSFIKISQFGGGTASLNVSVAAGIVLHRFHQWRLQHT